MAVRIKDMFDNQELSELKIIQLLDSEDSWWTIDELSKKLYLSKASTQKYLSLLTCRIDTFHNEHISIQKSPSKGIHLSRSLTFSPQILLEYFQGNRVAFSFASEKYY